MVLPTGGRNGTLAKIRRNLKVTWGSCKLAERRWRRIACDDRYDSDVTATRSSDDYSLRHARRSSTWARKAFEPSMMSR